jgi:hypothetical protein
VCGVVKAPAELVSPIAMSVTAPYGSYQPKERPASSAVCYSLVSFDETFLPVPDLTGIAFGNDRGWLAAQEIHHRYGLLI